VTQRSLNAAAAGHLDNLALRFLVPGGKPRAVSWLARLSVLDLPENNVLHLYGHLQ